MGINYSTAKHILSVFRKTGDIQMVKPKPVESKLNLDTIVDFSDNDCASDCETPSTKSKSFTFPARPELKHGVMLIPFKYNRQEG